MTTALLGLIFIIAPLRVDDADSFPWTVTLRGTDTLNNSPAGTTPNRPFNSGDTLVFNPGSTSVLADANGHRIAIYGSDQTMLVGCARNTYPGQTADAVEVRSGAVHVTDSPAQAIPHGFTSGRPIMIRTHNTTTAVKGTDFVVFFNGASSVRVKNNDSYSPVKTTVDGTTTPFPVDGNGFSTIVPYVQPVNSGGDSGTLSDQRVPPSLNRRSHAHPWVFLPPDAELLDVKGDPVPGYATGHRKRWAELREGLTFSTNPPLDRLGRPSTHATLVMPTGFRLRTLERSFVTYGVRKGVGRPGALTLDRGTVDIQNSALHHGAKLNIGTSDAAFLLLRREKLDVQFGYTPGTPGGSVSTTRLQVNKGEAQVTPPWPSSNRHIAPAVGNVRVIVKRRARVVGI